MLIRVAKSHRFAITLTIATAMIGIGSWPVLAKDKWINLRTKNFNIVSDADEGATRQLASNLEQFRYVFSQLFNINGVEPVPVTVIVFKNDGGFKPFKPLYKGKPANVAGYFQRGEDENLIALNIAGNEEHPMAVIFHEYTHLLTSYTQRPWPAWLLEGLAELYSSFAVDKNKVTLGMPISSHVYLLREKQFVPLQTLFKVDHKSPIYNEREKQGVFYAESWALAHYLMFGDKSARRPQLVEFIKLFDSGVEPDKAFAEALKTDYATMEKELRRYIGNDTYSGMNYFLKNMESQVDIAVQPLEEAEVQFYLGDLLLHTDRVDDSVAFFNQAKSLDAKLARPYEGLGFVAMRHSNYEQARQSFKEAISRNSQNHLAHYYYAEALMRDRMSGSAGIRQEASQEIIDELKKSIKLMPGFANSYHLMAEAYLAGDNLKESETALRAAIRLDPQNKYFALTLAQVQARQGAYDQARKTLAPLLGPDADPALKAPAESVMKYIEDYAAYRADSDDSLSARADPPTSTDTKEAPHLRRKGDTAETSGNRAADSDGPGRAAGAPTEPTAGATMKIEDTKIMDGVLETIECTGVGMVLVLRSNGRLMRFSVSDPVKLQFYSQDPDFHVNIGCGPINHAAFIHFKPVGGAQSGSAGDAVAVEFKK
jgi:tetratricopeptide (TPR) repeat protein